MTSVADEYTRYRLARARESIGEAEVVLASGYLNAAVSRAYYACFYAVSALLLTEGLSSSKHSGVRSLFERHWIKPGRAPVELGRFYGHIFDQRHKGDYADLTRFSEPDVRQWVGEAKAFVDHIAAMIEGEARSGDTPKAGNESAPPVDR